MNRDIHLIFEAYRNKKNKLVKEADIGAEYGAFLGAAKEGIVNRVGDTYLFSDLAKKTGKSAEEVVEVIIKPIYDSLFIDGKFNADGSEKDQLAKLQNAIHSSLVSSGYPKARAGYTARIIKNAITPAVQFLNDKADEGEVIDKEEVEDAVADSVVDTNTATGQELSAATGTETSTDGEQSDKPLAALMQYAIEEVGDGINENELIDTLKQHIVQKDSEISEGRATGQAKGIINKLVSAKVLSKRGNYLEPGENADEFAAKGDLSLVAADPEEYAQREFGVGGRPTTGRQVFGGEGGRYGVDFG